MEPQETREENLTLKERREQKRQEKLERRESVSDENKYRGWLWLAVVVVLLGVVFAMIKIVKNDGTSEPRYADILATITTADWIVNPTASTTLIEYSDFQCPACRNFEPYVQELRKEYGDQVRFIYRHFPLRVHKNARAASYAAEAAGAQGKFWEMHSALFANQDKWANLKNPADTFASYAQVLKLDVEKFKKDYASDEVKKKVEDQYASGFEFGVNSTPTFFLNNSKLQFDTYEEFKNAIKYEVDKK